MTGKTSGRLFIAAVLALTPFCGAANALDETKVAVKPKVVLVFDRECQIWCNKVKPIVQELEHTYKDKVEFVSLDTSADSFATSMSHAKPLGLAKFLSDNQDYAPVVGVFSARGKIVKELVGPKSKSIYEDAIAKALTK